MMVRMVLGLASPVPLASGGGVGVHGTVVTVLVEALDGARRQAAREEDR
jgi:hypothetical protein